MSTRSLNWLKLTAVVAPAFVLGLFFAGLLDFPRQSFAQDRAAHTPIVKVDAPRIPSARPLVELSDAYAAVAEAVRPSVVYIQSDRPVTVDPQSQIIGQLPPGFQQLLPRQQTPQRRGGSRQNDDQQQQLEHGSGSGFIVSSDGYILTNNHVIEGSSKVTVRLLNGREYNAKIVGTDKDTDIGVLKIDATGLTPAALGSSEATRVGEWVLAIGNPLGEDLTFTVTQGIVSAKGRGQLNMGDNDGGKAIQDYIQTDAVINRGNSGGPLVNARGEVIGINAAIASTTGYFTGYAFAVPIDLARRVMDQLVVRGRVERAGLGISVMNASREDAEYLGLPTVTGVRIESFPSETSPAKVAGLQTGDVIVAIDGQPIQYTSQLQQTVGFRRPGETVKVDVVRKDGKHEFSVKLVSLDQTAATVADAAPEPITKPDVTGSSSKSLLGAVTEPLTAATATEIGLPAATHGLLVRSTIDGTPAANKLCGADDCQGAPDVIISIEGKPVRSDEELKVAMASAVRGVVTLEIASGTKDHKGTIRIERIHLR
jgi:serine protease Do